MSMITAVVAAFDASTKHLRGTVNAEKTHCKHGHELAGENLSIYTYRGTKHSGVLSPVRFGRPRRCGDGPMMRGCMAMRWCVAVRGCVPRQYEAVGQ